MRTLNLLKLPFGHSEGWKELQNSHPSIPLLAWLVVLPLSLLPPVMFYYAGIYYSETFLYSFTDREFRFIATIIFLAEILSFFIIGWIIYAVANRVDELSISYQDSYLIAALAPLPLFVSSLSLLIPNLFLNAVVILSGITISCSLIYHGLKELCLHQEFEMATISVTYTIIAASALGWGILLSIIFAY
ncbi:YIP1 family protein [Vreelandella venusta]|uniref:YIP1 family protein n=1 Tax=Vreelandella venusta TaxID=44935 RepID=UPI00385110EF